MRFYQHRILREDYPGKAYKAEIHRIQQKMLRKALADAGLMLPSDHSVPDPAGLISLRIAHGPHGKPFLPDYPKFHYNFTDSGDWLVLAVSEGGSEIGVDLQRIVPVHAGIMNMARRFFHPDDIALLEQSSAAEGEDAHSPLFFRIWTIKEAYLKYTGEGLSGGMKRFPVNFADTTIGGVPFRELPPPEPGYCLSVCSYN